MRSLRHLLPAIALFTVSTLAWASAVPAPVRAAIFLRSAAYEGGVAERGGEVVVAVVRGKSYESIEDARAMASSFKGVLAQSRIAGRKGHVVEIGYEDATKTSESLNEAGAEVVYFATGLEGVIKDIPARQGGVSRILACADGDAMGSGCILSIGLADDKPKLVLNLERANAAGLRFPSEFLRLARIVR